MTLIKSRPVLVSHLVVVAAAALAAGCAVGPDFTRPQAPAGAGYTAGKLPTETATADGPGGTVQHLLEGKDIPGQWWTLFHSEPLNALIDQAFKANADVQAAQAALRVAQENVAAQQGAFFPQITGGFNGTRAKVAGSVSSNSSSPSAIYNLYTTQVAVSYVPDLWGGNRRQVESLEAQAESQRFQVEATYLTLTANVANAAVQDANLRGQIAATRDIITIESGLLDVLKKQFALGAVAEADVVAQEAALAQAEQSLPPLDKQLAAVRDQLAALTGRFPNQEVAGNFELASLHLPEDLPVSLPSQLVEQRPDIRAAEANLQAASAQIGVAIANRLPNITLNADLGSTAAVLTGKGGLFTPGLGFWDLAGNASAPLFDGFTLLHRERAARAAYDQAEAQYRSTVITAFQNVADSLHALSIDAEALKATAKAEHAAAESLAITRRQLELGAVSYLALLNAEQTELQAHITLVQAESARFADTVALFQSLGGGWWNRQDKAAGS